jgi:hypothetical protein
MKSEKKETTKELHSVERALGNLADNLEKLTIRERVLSARHSRGLSAFHWKVHETNIEAGQLLEKAILLGAFQRNTGLRRIITSTRSKPNPDYGHSSAFEYACLKWIPKQIDGFDFIWRRKQVGEVVAYAAALRYLADHLVG